jgi:branched-chain amino acid transport system ATP-binding protein
MLELTRVSAHYGKNQVLRAIDITVRAGEVVALVGANAAGKSTVMRVITGLKRASSGSIKFDGVEIGSLSTPKRVGLGVALVPEGRQLFAQSSVLENLTMGAYHRAEQQMVAIARGLMAKPKCLLLDEPSLGLAPVIVDEISLTITRLASEGMTILLSEQNAAMALDVATRAYVISAGAISISGTPAELKATPIVEQLYFGAEVPENAFA